MLNCISFSVCFTLLKECCGGFLSLNQFRLTSTFIIFKLGTSCSLSPTMHCSYVHGFSRLIPFLSYFSAAADTWSITARSGSPPPVPQTNRGVAAHSSRASAANETHNSNKDKSQSHLLLGIGSQFPVAGMLRHQWSVFLYLSEKLMDGSLFRRLNHEL